MLIEACLLSIGPYVPRKNILMKGFAFSRYYLPAVELDFNFITLETHFYPYIPYAKFNSFGQMLHDKNIF